MYNEKSVIECPECLAIFPPWDGDVITNAWQKDGYNHYDAECKCGHKDHFSIKIQDDE